jgi:protoporphyrinogen oxidase
VGGVIQSVRHGGYLAEFGPNSILETSPLISDLVRDLGLESRRVYSDPSAEKRYVVRDKKPVAEVPSFRRRPSDDAPVFLSGQAARFGGAVHPARAGRHGGIHCAICPAPPGPGVSGLRH